MLKTLIDCYSFGCKYNKDLHCTKSFMRLDENGKCMMRDISEGNKEE